MVVTLVKILADTLSILCKDLGKRNAEVMVQKVQGLVICMHLSLPDYYLSSYQSAESHQFEKSLMRLSQWHLSMAYVVDSQRT
jgi:hypothetical protein